MSTRRFALLAVAAAAIAFAALMSKFTPSVEARTQLGALNASEGIYINPKSFDIIKGTPKSDPTAQLMKLGAKEVNDGAVIIRVGDKLYLVDADPAAKSLYTGWAAEAFGRQPGG